MVKTSGVACGRYYAVIQCAEIGMHVILLLFCRFSSKDNLASIFSPLLFVLLAPLYVKENGFLGFLLYRVTSGTVD